MTTQICCFQDCFIFAEEGKGESNEKHGAAIYGAISNTIITYLSTIRCPGQDRTRHRGAQFDIQCDNEVTSSNINTTGGKSKYCSGIEYRHSQIGHFKFQTVTEMRGKFVTSFTSLTTEVDIFM